MKNPTLEYSFKTIIIWKMLKTIYFMLILINTTKNSELLPPPINPEFDSLTYYQLLGVKETATLDEIKRAYKKAAVKYHPDRNGINPKTNERFIRINKAYEVLSDSNLRRKYDTDGKLDMDDETKTEIKQETADENGIYDKFDDILTFKSGNFIPSVVHSNEYWIINFYSPHCVQCQNIAFSYRELASEFSGVIGIGAVNCFSDNDLCVKQGVYDLPQLKFYPKGEMFNINKVPITTHNLIDFVMKNTENKFHQFNKKHIDQFINVSNRNRPFLLVLTRSDKLNDVLSFQLKKIQISLKWMNALIGYMNCNKYSNGTFCQHLSPKMDYISLLWVNGINQVDNYKVLDNIELKTVMKLLHEIIPTIKILDNDEINIIEKDLRAGCAKSNLIIFFKDSHLSKYRIEIGRIVKLLVPLVQIVGIDCSKSHFCYQNNIHQFPTVALTKTNGIEIHYGNFFAREILNFYTLVSTTTLISLNDLTPQYLDQIQTVSNDTFIIYIFNSKCQPCIDKIWQFRRFVNEFNSETLNPKFFSLDCRYNYPICYRLSIVQGFPYVKYQQGHHIELVNEFYSAEDIHEFIKDINIKYVHDLTPDTFESLVINRKPDNFWFVDFYASWCSPCQKLITTINKLSKKYREKINFGKVQCDIHTNFCQLQKIYFYPTLRMFPSLSQSDNMDHYVQYNNWNHYHLLDQFIHSFLPSLVVPMDPTNFNQLFHTDLQKSWLIDFYAQWCSPCLNFMPIFEKLAQNLKSDSLKFGKVECSANKDLCDQFPIEYYPTLLLYPSLNRHTPIKIQHSFNDITKMENEILFHLKIKRDEL